MAKIQLNGRKVKVKTPISLEEILKKYNLASKQVAIQLNGIIIPKSNFKKKQIKKDDKIEVVHFIGGG